MNNDMYNNSRYLYVHRFIVREYVYYNVLYVTHDNGSDEFLREEKRANTIMRARQEGERGNVRERYEHVCKSFGRKEMNAQAGKRTV
jgi:hypothetical protein